MNQQIKIQIFGLSLAIATAIGCVAYEKIVKTQSFLVTASLCAIAYFPFAVSSVFFQKGFKSEPLNKWWIVIFIASGCTGPLWYWITRTKTVLTSSVFEIKYIAILVLFSIFMGEKGVTLNTVFGAFLAMGSIYFISK
jgi:drug/metabolite transporter (DMT)-like permease